MKIVNEKGRLFGLINVIDLIIILILALVIFAGVYIVGSGALARGERTEVNFTVEFIGVEEWFADIVEKNIGGEVRDSVRGDYLGVITHVERASRKLISWNAIDERFQSEPVPGEYTVLMSVRANGTESDSEILAEGQPIRVGLEVFIKGLGFAREGYVVELSTGTGADSVTEGERTDG